MKLTIIGGGGLRTPLAIPPILRRAKHLGLEELCLMDINEEKLRIFSAISREQVKKEGDPFRISSTTDACNALDGANFVITTIRVGNDYGRVLDERIALRHGIIGQETTGAGGFAMAMRSIPAILDYAKLLEEVSPGAWILNFTNPAGMVTQALRDQGFERTIGICDSANGAQKAAANWHGIKPSDVQSEVFGLNHLSWARSVTHAGQDLLPSLLRDAQFQSGTYLRLFAPELIEDVGMWLNEYLFYWYYSKQAIEAMNNEKLTRGETIMLWNQELLNYLRQVDFKNDPNVAREHYNKYMNRRIGTYMNYGVIAKEQLRLNASSPTIAEEEGYMGVALDTILSLHTGNPSHTALNVPNRGAIACMAPEDVVEVSCRVDGSGVHPVQIGEISEHQKLLMQTVKLYEKLAVEAVLERSRFKAAKALMIHPLVYSYPLAKQLVNEYLEAHAEYVGVWA